MKDYKKILEEIVDIIRTTEKSDIGFANICTYIGENCPELKESEDERIRKELIDAINGLWANDALPMPFSLKRKDSWIAWLEKQGEKPQVDGFDAELNALLKKYEHLPYDETIECLKYYVGVLVNMRNKAMEGQQ